MTNKPKIVFILDSISQPRCIKRVKSFIRNGFDVEVYGFDRGMYNVNAKIEGKEINILSFAESGKGYLRKFINAVKHICKVTKKHRKENVIYYVFGFDNSLIISALKSKKYIYEIGDIMYTYFGNVIIRNLLLLIDKIIIKRSLLTVLITGGMEAYLYGTKSPSNVIIQQNKVDWSFINTPRKSELLNENKHINFGFAGAIRYENTVFRFAKIVGKEFPQHSFYFYGEPIDKNNETIKEMASRYNNIHFMGSFRNPQDLEAIYSNIDIVVACYETNTVNERFAEPNKLYEALFFCKPLIVSKYTYLDEIVTKKNDFGYSIDATNDLCIENFIRNITKDNINTKINNIANLPKDIIVDDNGKRIIEKLMSVIN